MRVEVGEPAIDHASFALAASPARAGPPRPGPRRRDPHRQLGIVRCCRSRRSGYRHGIPRPCWRRPAAGGHGNLHRGDADGAAAPGVAVLKILVSGCLGGAPIRFNETGVPIASSIWQRWVSQGRLVSLCPELAVGFPVPRPPAEIVGGSAADVLDGRAQVHEASGRDVTELFQAAAQRAVDKALQVGVGLAILVEGSPTCGSTYVHDGTFTGVTVAGRGVASRPRPCAAGASRCFLTTTWTGQRCSGGAGTAARQRLTSARRSVRYHLTHSHRHPVSALLPGRMPYGRPYSAPPCWGPVGARLSSIRGAFAVWKRESARCLARHDSSCTERSQHYRVRRSWPAPWPMARQARLNCQPETRTVRAAVDLSAHRAVMVRVRGRHDPLPHRR
ncbi:2-thiouracil desulfurase family protein [Micromonospora sp. NPDC048947]|uniref:DUF523 domain-containing protein n=1 Tax=Micromonospora sp. NPDC048947 TaxID=3154826 RepID=UPI0033D3EC0E